MSKRNTILAAGAIALGLTLAATTGAVAGSRITSADIKDHTIRAADIKPGLVEKFSQPGAAGADGQDGADGADGAQGPAGPRGPQGQSGNDGAQGPAGADGADAGISAAGAGYDSTWAAGSYGETVETCGEGEYVTGGGYSTWGGAGGDNSKDLGGGNADIQVTVSAPYIASDAAYVPISDSDSRFYADRWVVRGFNHGDTDQIVRAWVLCAPIPN